MYVPTTSMFRSSTRFSATLGMSPPVNPTTTQRPPSVSDRIPHDVDAAAIGESQGLILPGSVAAQDHIRPSMTGDTFLGIGRHDRDCAAIARASNLDSCGARAAGGSVDQYHLAGLHPPANLEPES